jgi:hypothetical protein
MAGSGVIEGPLSKWTNVMKGWQYRWFVLDEVSGLLSYYTVSTLFMKYLKNSCCFLFSAWFLFFLVTRLSPVSVTFMQWSSKVEEGTGPLHIKCLPYFDSVRNWISHQRRCRVYAGLCPLALFIFTPKIVILLSCE